jgi:hypothetical protein
LDKGAADVAGARLHPRLDRDVCGRHVPSRLSTNGAIVLANAIDVDRQVFFRRLLAYGAVVVAVAPFVLWLTLVVPAS